MILQHFSWFCRDIKITHKSTQSGKCGSGGAPGVAPSTQAIACKHMEIPFLFVRFKKKIKTLKISFTTTIISYLIQNVQVFTYSITINVWQTVLRVLRSIKMMNILKEITP